MAAKIVISVLVLLGCLSESEQRCFSYHCPHHSLLSECIQGTYQCQTDEFCEVTTHLDHGNAPWVAMDCRPLTDLEDCVSVAVTNDPNCDPNTHDRMCHWCCAGDQCVQGLTMGVFPTGGTGPLMTTVTDAPGMTGGMTGAVTGGMTGVSDTLMPDSTAPPAAVTTLPPATTPVPCNDLYLGNCATDFVGRCQDAIIARMCQKTCAQCP